MAETPRYWWVNQGATFRQERAGGFIWAPLRNKANRTQSHWETLTQVRPGDIILHYSNGFLRAVSTAQMAAEDAANPLDTDMWDKDGRIILTHYLDLQTPIPLAEIPERLRAGRGGPFTVVGSVQQGYLFPVDQDLFDGLIAEFPELRAAAELAGAVPTELFRPATTSPVAIAREFAAAVDASGLVLEDDTLVRSFLSAALAKPFVILVGLSGSGKTQLALQLGKWFDHNDKGRSRYELVAVRPDWTGPEAVFGYRDRDDGWFVPKTLEFIRRANDDPDHPYVLVLDEMNLAHVERYFSDFLSGVESREPVLFDGTLIPRNLIVVGTVNMDETTYPFSRKVLDRASVFEFRVSADSLRPGGRRPHAVKPADGDVLRGFCALMVDDDWHLKNPHPSQDILVERLRAAHDILGTVGFEFGHRTFYDALRFAAFYAASGDSDPTHALDLIVVQKLLPRLHGSRRRMGSLVADLQTFASDLPISHDKLRRMSASAAANQFVSFTE